MRSVWPYALGHAQKTPSLSDCFPMSTPVKHSASYVGENVLIETVLRPEGLRYLVWNGKAEIRENYPNGKLVLAPPIDKNQIALSGIIVLATEPGEKLTTSEIIEVLTTYIKKYVDCPPFWAKMSAYYALMSWVYDRFTALPYLRLLGDWGSGKSRSLMVIGQVCYKSVIVSGATTLSPIFRLLDQYRGTLTIDEADFRESEAWSELVKLFNCGYMKGIPLLRSERVGNDFEPRSFTSFGPKIMATRERFTDDALESRCLTRQIVKSEIADHIPRSLPISFEKETQHIRNLLLRWRLENYYSINADESQLLDLEPRQTQIANPLYACAEGDDAFRLELKSMLRSQASDAKVEGPHVHIVAALEAQKGRRVKIGDIAKAANEVASDLQADIITAKKAGIIIRSFGFDVKPSKGTSWFTVDPILTESLVQQYLFGEDGDSKPTQDLNLVVTED